MSKVIEKLVGNLMSKAVEITRSTKIHVFVDYSAHVDKLNVEIYEGGWHPGYEDNESYRDIDLSDVDKLQVVYERLCELNNDDMDKFKVISYLENIKLRCEEFSTLETKQKEVKALEIAIAALKGN